MLMYSHSLLRRRLFVVLHVASVISRLSGFWMLFQTPRHPLISSRLFAEHLFNVTTKYNSKRNVVFLILSTENIAFQRFKCVYSIISEIICRLQDVCKRYGILFNTSASVFWQLVLDLRVLSVNIPCNLNALPL